MGSEYYHLELANLHELKYLRLPPGAWKIINKVRPSMRPINVQIESFDKYSRIKI
ncbi:MAG: hypothetical protein ACHQ6U_03120 [Thermodesulfobacteriota bacterium]